MRRLAKFVFFVAAAGFILVLVLAWNDKASHSAQPIAPLVAASNDETSSSAQSEAPVVAASSDEASVKPTPPIPTSGCDDKKQSEDITDAVAGDPFRDPLPSIAPDAAIFVEDGEVKAVRSRIGGDIPVCILQTPDVGIFIPGDDFRVRMSPQNIDKSPSSFTVKLIMQFKTERAQSEVAATITPASENLSKIRFLVQDTLIDMDRHKALSYDRYYLDESGQEVTMTNNRQVLNFEGTGGYVELAGTEIEKLFDISQRSMRAARGGSLF